MVRNDDYELQDEYDLSLLPIMPRGRYTLMRPIEVLEIFEEIGLANAIKAGRQNDFVGEDDIFVLLDGQA